MLRRKVALEVLTRAGSSSGHLDVAGWDVDAVAGTKKARAMWLRSQVAQG